MLKAFLVKILRVMFDFGFYYIVISPVIFCYIRKYVFIYAPYAVIDGNLIEHSVNNTFIIVIALALVISTSGRKVLSS